MNISVARGRPRCKFYSSPASLASPVYMYDRMYVCMYVCMYLLMYDYIYVLFVCQMLTHWHRGLNPFWPHMFGFKPLLGLEPMAPIRPQLLVSHANHSATETSIYVCMYVCMCVNVCIYVRECMYEYVCT